MHSGNKTEGTVMHSKAVHHLFAQAVQEAVHVLQKPRFCITSTYLLPLCTTYLFKLPEQSCGSKAPYQNLVLALPEACSLTKAKLLFSNITPFCLYRLQIGGSFRVPSCHVVQKLCFCKTFLHAQRFTLFVVIVFFPSRKIQLKNFV